MAVYKTSNSGLLTRREYTSFLAGNSQFIPFEPSGAYDSIATVTLSSTTTITFSSIPASYTHLQIRIMAKTDRPTYNNDLLSLRFNGDTGSNYAYHQVQGNGSSAVAAQQSSITKIYGVGNIGDTVNAAQNYGVAIIDILDYANTSKYKTIKSLSGYDANGAGSDPGIVAFSSGLWMSTSAINSVTLLAAEGTGLTSGSTAALYGIKGN